MSPLLRWQVGAVRITRVQELAAPGMRFIVPQATIDNLAGIPWLTPFLAANGDAMGSVHALVLEVADQRIMVDTCIGNDKERRIPSWHNPTTTFALDRFIFPADAASQGAEHHQEAEDVPGTSNRRRGVLHPSV